MVLLLDELKGYLKITWDEEDSQLEGIIKRGKAYLTEIAGTELIFEEDLVAKQLLLDYGRYVYNHSFELFEINFKRELLRLSLREAVRDRAKKNTETNS